MSRSILTATAIAGAAATIIGLTGLSVGAVSAMSGRGPDFGAAAGSSCATPQLAGTVVNVSLRNMGGSMMGGDNGMMGGNTGNGMMHRGAMNLSLDRSSVSSGTVSFLATNDGSISHELVILPLVDSHVAGSRSISGEHKIDETASLGEASATCKAGEGTGIAPGSAGWVTLDLPPGRYEVICNLPGHYAAGMYQELTVT
ncbi:MULTISPECIES: sulfocyanin-like copper-binding protein [unclassified Cryobacterium]|uniref:sulfocyanin-like copper-binding protein n=1 Tax=unclassified Cryobacterium TaxID=2649013 RepID=UPI002AB3B1F7|nr:MULTISPECIES: sulfocyanin-like copper-binding protein [unclassified Cryobacterium]MDY7526867.1 sulfocyanin-like copper-binding protein [Cryobacterium sp. 10C2]MDY7557331.1 sulfocyanin-like copper-binding protein [Cryobacterium sp. 10C3]MEB0003584.1 sulfocyanin-like copper-binding protein [Cryobacterium sp. RTC2.1]MEB0202548.1 sulfocyanin-like copper-binding protein [Cryobacterium sp. 5I3]MEB0288143.1 sulfocyanin-like copper-binding protein [Cryobacterium sp. 10S3]